MQFVSDPPISVKIRKMKERVRWREPQIVERGIDQTRMVLEDGWTDSPEFSFLVIGDTGSGAHRGVKTPNDGSQNLCWHSATPAVLCCTPATSSIWLARVSSTQKLY